MNSDLWGCFRKVLIRCNLLIAVGSPNSEVSNIFIFIYIYIFFWKSSLGAICLLQRSSHRSCKNKGAHWQSEPLEKDRYTKSVYPKNPKRVAFQRFRRCSYFEIKVQFEKKNHAATSRLEHMTCFILGPES